MTRGAGFAESLAVVCFEEKSREYIQQAIEQNAVYAFFDACDDSEIQALVQNEEFGAVSLYHGASATKFKSIAPYLCRVNSILFAKVEDELTDRHWGYYLIADSGMELAQLRRHFRKFLLVEGPDARELYFRFYDPRVITTFLRASTRDEAAEFFGMVQEFIVPKNQEFVGIRLKTTEKS